jgi:hypothetical protein
MKTEGPLHTLLPSTRHSRAPDIQVCPHRVSLDTRFRGYDVIQVASANRTGMHIQRSSLVNEHKTSTGRVLESAGTSPTGLQIAHCKSQITQFEPKWSTHLSNSPNDWFFIYFIFLKVSTCINAFKVKFFSCY